MAKRTCTHCDTDRNGWFVVCWTYKKKRYCKKVPCKCKKLPTIRFPTIGGLPAGFSGTGQTKKSG